MNPKLIMKIGVVIVGAGSGRRLGRPKANLLLGGKPLFYYSLKTFTDIKKIKQVVLVLQKAHFKIAKKFINNKKINLSEGGRTRKESVLNGLDKINQELDYVLIHDCARPFVKKKTILTVIKELKKYPAVVPGIRAKDTLKELKGKRVKKTLKRNNIFSIQTPQGFKKDLIKSAYKKYKGVKATDSARILEENGQVVKVVEGDLLNFKLTYPEDFYIAKLVKKDGKV